MSRGAAFADYDSDGDTDVAVNNFEGLRFCCAMTAETQRGGWHRVDRFGRKYQRTWAEAEVVGQAHYGASDAIRGSYLSSHDMRLLFGLDAAQMVDRVTVRWSSGKKQTRE